MNYRDMDNYFLEEEKVADSFKKLPGRLVGKKQNDKRDPGEVLAYLRHHGLFGNIVGVSGFSSTINSAVKSKNGAKKLYPKYVAWCVKHDVKPSSEKTFMKIAKLYYTDRLRGKATRLGTNVIGSVGSNVLANKGQYELARTVGRVSSGVALGSDLGDSLGRNERVLSKLKEDYMDGYLEAYFDFTND